MDFKNLKIHKKNIFCKLFFFCKGLCPARPCCRAVCAQRAPAPHRRSPLCQKGLRPKIFFPALIKYSINVLYNTTNKYWNKYFYTINNFHTSVSTASASNTGTSVSQSR